MSHSEQFMTAVLDKVAQAAVDGRTEAGTWEKLDMYQRQQVKRDLLPLMVTVLDAAKEVRGETHVASCFPVQDEMVSMALLATSISDNGRSEWRWLRTADGDLFMALSPTGEMYEALSVIVDDDYRAALEGDLLHNHTTTVED